MSLSGAEGDSGLAWLPGCLEAEDSWPMPWTKHWEEAGDWWLSLLMTIWKEVLTIWMDFMIIIFFQIANRYNRWGSFNLFHFSKLEVQARPKSENYPRCRWQDSLDYLTTLQHVWTNLPRFKTTNSNSTLWEKFISIKTKRFPMLFPKKLLFQFPGALPPTKDTWCGPAWPTMVLFWYERNTMIVSIGPFRTVKLK